MLTPPALAANVTLLPTRMSGVFLRVTHGVDVVLVRGAVGRSERDPQAAVAFERAGGVAVLQGFVLGDARGRKVESVFGWFGWKGRNALVDSFDSLGRSSNTIWACGPGTAVVGG